MVISHVLLVAGSGKVVLQQARLSKERYEQIESRRIFVIALWMENARQGVLSRLIVTPQHKDAVERGKSTLVAAVAASDVEESQLALRSSWNGYKELS
jgi:hypothetical protein